MPKHYEEYKNRVHFKGKTKREYVKTKVEESIKSLIEDSQYGFSIDVYDKANKNYNTHDVAILSTKTTQEYEAANIIAPLSVGLDKGSIFLWGIDEKTTKDYWIVLKKMFRPDQPGFNGIAYRCNGDLNWIDKDGVLHSQPAYIRSGRITNALGVTPDVNRFYDNLVLHDTDWNMMAATQFEGAFHPEMRFIIKGQAYRITNVDNVSIDNVSILSFATDKLLDTDDTTNMIAYDEAQVYNIVSKLAEDTKLYAGDIMTMPLTILKQGKPIDADFILESSDPAIIEIQGKKIVGRGIGTANIKCSLTDNKTVSITIPVEVVKQHPENQAEQLYIIGDDYIYWGSTQDYIISSGEPCTIKPNVKSKIKHTITNLESGVRIHIEDKYSGTIELTCETEQGTIKKTVYIRTV